MRHFDLRQLPDVNEHVVAGGSGRSYTLGRRWAPGPLGAGGKRRISQDHLPSSRHPPLSVGPRHRRPPGGEAAEARAGKLKNKIATLRAQMQALKAMEAEVAAAPDGKVSLTDPGVLEAEHDRLQLG